MQAGLDTRPIEMQPMWALMFQAPQEDVDRIFEAVWRGGAAGAGQDRPQRVSRAGGHGILPPARGRPHRAEDETRQRPGVDEMRFFLPRDEAMLRAVIEAVYEVHSYYEPVITVTEVLRSQCKGWMTARTRTGGGTRTGIGNQG